MSTYFAAYDQNSIYGIGTSPAAAIEDARANGGANCETAAISEAMFFDIRTNGWDGMRQSFDVINGQIVETTE